MIELIYTHILFYLNRPMVVVIDVLLFILIVIVTVGIFSLRKQVNDLSVAVKTLRSKIISK